MPPHVSHSQVCARVVTVGALTVTTRTYRRRPCQAPQNAVVQQRSDKARKGQKPSNRSAASGPAACRRLVHDTDRNVYAVHPSDPGSMVFAPQFPPETKSDAKKRVQRWQATQQLHKPGVVSRGEAPHLHRSRPCRSQKHLPDRTTPTATATPSSESKKRHRTPQLDRQK